MKRKTKFKQTEIGMIPEDWGVKRIRELGNKKEVVLTGPFGSLLHSSDYAEDGVPLLLVNSIEEGRLSGKELPKVDFRKANDLKRFWLKEGDIVFTRVGVVGRTLYIDKEKENWMFSGQTLRIRLNDPSVYPRFIDYYFRNPLAQQLSDNTSLGTTRPSINTKILADRFVPIPKFAEQKYIAKILSDLDSKIELNQKMNKTLEAIGQAIFKHWFVDFEFPNEEGKQYKSSGGEMVYSEELGKEIPKGWAVIPLDQAAEFTRGFSYRGSEKSKTNGEYAFVTLNSVKEFGGFKREFSYITSDRVKEKHFVQLGDIVISNTEQTKTGTLLGYPALVEFPFQYEKGKGIFSHHITKATPKLENLKHYLYHHLFIYQQNAVKYHTGSVIWALDVANWSKNERIILPSQETLRKFESFVENIFLKSIENNLEVETLSRIRDSLLPKLMSGKIRVPIEAT